MGIKIGNPFGMGNIRETRKSITLSANNTTARVDVFQFVGTVLIHRIWAEVTTVISANHTANFLQTDDATAQVAITASGATLSGLAVGTVIYKEGLAATALTLLNNAAARVGEPPVACEMPFSPFTVTQKTAVASHIEMSYATTDTPATGALLWHALWEPLTAGANLLPA